MSSIFTKINGKPPYMSTIRERIKQRRKELRISQQTVGDYANVSRNAVSMWETGDSKGLKPESLVKAAEILKTTEKWLTFGIADKIVDKNIEKSNVEPGPEITGRIPLISFVQAGQWAEVIDNHLPGDAEQWIYTTARVSKNSFALRVVGDSMTNPNGAPSIPEGYIITVDPNKQAENGSLIVARLDDSMEATFKKLVIDGSKRYLKPLNPAYPVIEINGNCTICGAVVRVEWEP